MYQAALAVIIALGKRAFGWLWPLFLKYIGPKLQNLLLRIVTWNLFKKNKKFKAWLDKLSQKWTGGAEDIVSEKEGSARNATTDSVKIHYQEIAEEWRAIAQHYRTENQVLRAMVAEHTASKSANSEPVPIDCEEKQRPHT